MEFVAHDKPALRNESNYIARIDLSPFGFHDVFEQVWLKITDGNVGELCCIPYRAYGISLRDIVRLSDDGANVVELVERSGRRVLRTLMAAELSPQRARVHESEMALLVKQAGLLSEWCGDRQVAVDVPEDEDPADLLAYLKAGELSGQLHWEWGDAESFSI